MESKKETERMPKQMIEKTTTTETLFGYYTVL